MRRLVKLLLFSAATIFFLTVAACIQMSFLAVLKNPRQILTKISTFWAKVMLWILEIHVSVNDPWTVNTDPNYLIVSNHLSYLDVIIIASVIPTLFVAKKDVQSWPVLGWLASLGGTLFIDRKSFRGAKNSIHEIEQALRNKSNVHIFPEGTSGNGETLLPFKSALFHSALAANTSVLPITLNYENINNRAIGISNRDIVYWYGDMTFTDHFWKVLRQHSINVSLSIHSEISPENVHNCKNLAIQAQNAVNTSFHSLNPSSLR